MQATVRQIRPTPFGKGNWKSSNYQRTHQHIVLKSYIWFILPDKNPYNFATQCAEKCSYLENKWDSMEKEHKQFTHYKLQSHSK